MTDRSKGWAEYSMTVDGSDRYHPVKLAWGEEFYLDETSVEKKWRELRGKALQELKAAGLIS